MNTDDLREEFEYPVSKCLMHTDVGYDYFTDDYVLWLEKQLLLQRTIQKTELLSFIKWYIEKPELIGWDFDVVIDLYKNNTK